MQKPINSTVDPTQSRRPSIQQPRFDIGEAKDVHNPILTRLHVFEDVKNVLPNFAAPTSFF